MSTSIYAYFGRVLPSRVVVIICVGGGVFYNANRCLDTSLLSPDLLKDLHIKRTTLKTNSIRPRCC